MKLCRADGCDTPAGSKRAMCGAHNAYWHRHGTFDGFSERRARAANGRSGWRVEKGYVVRYAGNRCIRQHREVMEQHLGRELLPSETVHHLNGDRTDNRLANLELWSTSQPYGQRVADKVAWARELLALYGSEHPAG